MLDPEVGAGFERLAYTRFFFRVVLYKQRNTKMGLKPLTFRGGFDRGKSRATKLKI